MFLVRYVPKYLISTLIQKDSKRAVRIMCFSERGLGHWFVCSQRMGETNACLSKKLMVNNREHSGRKAQTQSRDANAGEKFPSAEMRPRLICHFNTVKNPFLSQQYIPSCSQCP